MMILINSGTASAAEIVAGALHEKQRVLLIGSQTFGRGIIRTIFKLEDGSGLSLPTHRYYTPLGHIIEVRGIEPDVKIAEEGRDDKPLRIAKLALKELSISNLDPKEKMSIQLLESIKKRESN